MMRNGLWQQKQKRPTACLLCRFTYGYGPFTRPARRAPFNGRDFSTNELPRWATQSIPEAPTTTPNNSGLLPHELAAREKALSRNQPPPPPPPRPRAPPNTRSGPARAGPGNDGLLPHERAAREKALARSQPVRPGAMPMNDGLPPRPAQRPLAARPLPFTPPVPPGRRDPLGNMRGPNRPGPSPANGGAPAPAQARAVPPRPPMPPSANTLRASTPLTPRAPAPAPSPAPTRPVPATALGSAASVFGRVPGLNTPTTSQPKVEPSAPERPPAQRPSVLGGASAAPAAPAWASSPAWATASPPVQQVAPTPVPPSQMASKQVEATTPETPTTPADTPEARTTSAESPSTPSTLSAEPTAPEVSTQPAEPSVSTVSATPDTSAVPAAVESVEKTQPLATEPQTSESPPAQSQTPASGPSGIPAWASAPAWASTSPPVQQAPPTPPPPSQAAVAQPTPTWATSSPQVQQAPPTPLPPSMAAPKPTAPVIPATTPDAKAGGVEGAVSLPGLDAQEVQAATKPLAEAPKKAGWASALPAWASAAPQSTPSTSGGSPPTTQPQPGGWASAAPSWAAAAPGATPSAAGGPTGAQPDVPKPQQQQADPLSFLLPHERAARERALARHGPAEPANPPPTAANPWGDTGGVDQEFAALQSRRTTRVGASPGVRSDGAQKRPPGDLSDLVRSIRESGKSLFVDPQQQTSSSDSASAGGGDWKNLARRDRTPPPSFTPPAFDSTPPPPPVRRTPPAPTPGVDWAAREEAWDAMLEADGKNRRETLAKAEDGSWDWADDHTAKAKEEKAARAVREAEEQGAVPGAVSGDAAAAQAAESDRRKRGARGGREEPVAAQKKTKKTKNRRRQSDYENDDDFDVELYELKQQKKAEKAQRERERQLALEDAGPTPILLPEFISVANLAIALGLKIDVFVSQLEELGFEDVGKDNILTGETAALVAQEYGFEPKVDMGEDEDLRPAPVPEDPTSLPLRPPVVTIMGHVDHGKTTLLDYLRKSSIVSQEHGGITQHIGAFSVQLSSGQQITFLDTPGHAAFLSMRQRGANVTDMVILVVAADDSVMPQTLEALKHARAARVPFIVAINKIDRPEANINHVKSDLAKHGVELEDFGGDVQVVCVSGKTGQGMEDLEENILLLAEMLDIRADPGGMAEGWVLESTIKPIGRVATVLVKRGTLRPGDYVVAGRVQAKIRSLRNEAGVEIDEAGPGMPVEVLGWKEPPEAGDMVLQAPDEGRAKAAVRYRQELKERGDVIGQMEQIEKDRRERERERELEKEALKSIAEAANLRPNRRGGYRMSPEMLRNAAATAAEEAAAEAAAGDDGDGNGTARSKIQQVPFIVKGDVHGSVEAVSIALMEQGNNEIRAKVLVSAPGHITESDVELAATTGSAIINFNNPVPPQIKRLAQDAKVKILEHNVIYHLIEEVREQLAEALPMVVVKKVVADAVVLQVFPINIKGRKYKNIAGCRIENGIVKRGTKARVIRGKENVYEGMFPPFSPLSPFLPLIERAR
ncbi:hypothetical protein B0J18DRAFT_438008 [Chaetomium sp. MPI-SDFR-AT-0129]|nr:hypothetical protein B0J18DRAFT_438008 [Chaetomium sp. MPI-SDFR-AT-0129]